MAARDALDRLKLERLRAALVAGEQSGLAEDFSMEQLMAQLDEEARAEAPPGWLDIGLPGQQDRISPTSADTRSVAGAWRSVAPIFVASMSAWASWLTITRSVPRETTSALIAGG
jgi:hypothetical protein